MMTNPVPQHDPWENEAPEHEPLLPELWRWVTAAGLDLPAGERAAVVVYRLGYAAVTAAVGVFTVGFTLALAGLSAYAVVLAFGYAWWAGLACLAPCGGFAVVATLGVWEILSPAEGWRVPDRKRSRPHG